MRNAMAARVAVRAVRAVFVVVCIVISLPGVACGGVAARPGFLLAFPFTSAAARFEARRHLVVEGANAIETVWLRLDLLPAADAPAIRTAMRAYVDARLHMHRVMPDVAASEAAERE